VRRCHFLRDNKATQLPNQFVCVDTETDAIAAGPGVVRHRLRFGWASYQRTVTRGQWTAPEWYRFTSGRQFWSWAEARSRERTRLYVFAHNWSFDATVLDTFTILPKRGWALTRAVIESPPIILAWRRLASTIEMLDTLNFFAVPLRDLGQHLGLEKLPMPEQTASRGDWDTYARRDVEILRRAMLSWWAFLDAHDLGGFAKTLAGQSMRAFRHGRMPAKILIDDDVRACVLAREALLGGRVEAFRLGRVKTPVIAYDVNSMYPAVMGGHDYPTALRLYARNPTRREFYRWIERYCCVARVNIETDTPQYAHKVDGVLTFPVGRLRAVLTTPDLVAAVEAGHFRECEEIALYEPAPIFHPYVTELYGLRRQAMTDGDEVKSYLLKLLLNALYGKFAQRGTVWHKVAAAEDATIKTWSDLDFDTGVIREYRQFCGIIQERAAGLETQESHPAIAAHVTAWARRKLWDLINVANREEVVYVDTDSLFVTWIGAKALEPFTHGRALGFLRTVARYEWVHIFGAKDYATPERWTCKGVRGNALWINSRKIEQEEWSTLRGMVQRGDLGPPETRKRVMLLGRKYTKGVRVKGGRVLPFRLREW